MTPATGGLHFGQEPFVKPCLSMLGEAAWKGVVEVAKYAANPAGLGRYLRPLLGKHSVLDQLLTELR